MRRAWNSSDLWGKSCYWCPSDNLTSSGIDKNIEAGGWHRAPASRGWSPTGVSGVFAGSLPQWHLGVPPQY
jgi:hypothetical protein